MFFEHRGSVNFELGIVQVKQRFHGGTRGKKATNISSEDYAFFVCAKSERERETGSELGLHFGSDTGHETEETRGHSVFMARARGHVRDTTEGDDEESTSGDVESEDELTERDDNSRRPRTSQST